MSRNPVFNDNKLKLGTFGTNGIASSFSLAPEVNKLTWPLMVEMAQICDEAGMEALVPVARWLGYSDKTYDHYSGDAMDCYTWAAAMAQATKHIGVFVTSHATTIHPLLAAKQTATLDIISGGRLGYNVVGGWVRHELEMFGEPLKDHSKRYDYLAEWMYLIEKLWTLDEPFDHEGEFFKITGGFTIPKPVQKPRPLIMNAGGSERGMRFACENADMCFVIVKSEDPEQIRAEVDTYKNMARETFGRDVMVWTYAFVVQRDTQKEADDYLHYYAVEMEDTETVLAWMKGQGVEAKWMAPEALDELRMRVAAGGGGFPLVGTPEGITEKLQMLSDCGIDGVLLSWGDFPDGLPRFVDGVLPLLEQAGLRKPFAGS